MLGKEKRILLKPKKVSKPDKEKIKETIKSTINIDDEVKLLRITLYNVISELNLKGYDDFIEYHSKIEGIKKNIKG